MYTQSLPAGSFRGLGQMYAGREGASVPARARNQALRRVGIAGLGSGLAGPDLCTDPGWQMAQNLMGSVSQVIGAAAAGHAGADGATTGGDAGWRAVGATGAGVAQAWSATCAQQTRTTTGAGGSTSGDASGAYASALAAMQASQQSSRDDMTYLAAQQQQQQAAQAAAAATSRNNMLMIGGGVLVAGVLAYLVLGRK